MRLSAMPAPHVHMGAAEVVLLWPLLSARMRFSRAKTGKHRYRSHPPVFESFGHARRCATDDDCPCIRLTIIDAQEA